MSSIQQPSIQLPSVQLPKGDLWVFGYGSLMWRPGFEFIERHTARLYGYHRALCVWSWVHRGTREQPGLVFGLDVGGSCIGRVFRVTEKDKYSVADYLYRREMVTSVYHPKLHRVYINQQQSIIALCFTVDRAHAQYSGKLSVEQAACTVAHARGQSGPNPEYLYSTVQHMQELDIHEPSLLAIKARLDSIRAEDIQ